MYHIANDLRAKKSAELICQGLEECLKEMPLNKIHIVDIYKKCFVSRATFYRLFDTIEDVFAYECDLIREDTMKAVKTAKFKNKNEEVLFCIKRWLKHETLIKAMIDNRLVGILYDSHMRNAESLKEFYAIYYESDTQFNCFLSLLISIIFAALSIYFKEKGKTSVEEVFEAICYNTSKIIDSWKSGVTYSHHLFH